MPLMIEPSAISNSRLVAIADKIDQLAIWSGRLAAWLILPMVFSLCYEVIARYLFNAPTLWAYDMTFMLYGSFFMLGAAFTLQRKGHVRTDSFYADWSPKRQAWTDLICYLVMFFPFVSVFLFVGWGYFVKAFVTNETFVTSAWQPITWPFKMVMPLTGLLLFIQGISECLKCIHTLRFGQWPQRAAPSAVIV
jgi:TRAP-type mannitol/chloroaromatic compound transport system permease small subunit